MPHHTPLIAILAAGFVLAFLLGALAHRLRLSPLVGYLLAGIAIGPFTPGFVADQALAVELSEIGVILLMFGVGLHFSIDDLLKVKHIAVPGAIVQIGVATALGWGLAAWLGWPTVQGLVFGLALSVASTVVLLRAMEDRRLLDTPRGRIAVGWLIVEDLVMVLALVVLPALAEGMGEGGEAGVGGGLLLTLAITLAKVTAFVALMLIVGRRLIPWMLERVAGTGSRELFTLCILAIAMGIAVGSAQLFGVSFALGAFFAGMLLNESELSHEAANDSLPMRDAFAVLFFVSVGMLFNPAVLLREPLLVLAVVLIIVFGKSVAAYAIVRAFGHPRGTALTISASLAQIGEFSFILAGLGVSLSLLPAQGRDLILAGAILSIIANPFLFVLLDRAQARAKARAGTEGAVGAPPVAEETPPGPPLVAEDHVIMVGFGRVGSHLAALLQQRGVNLVVIDTNPYHIERAHQAGFAAIRGNAASAPVLAEARVDVARMAVIAVAQALEAGEIVDRLREANSAITVFARAHSDAEVKHLLEHGADGAVLAERELACSMAEMILATPPYRTSRAAPLALGA